MSLIVTNPGNAVEAAVGASSAQFSLAMNANGMPAQILYAFVANVDCWIAQGVNPTASAASGSAFVPARTMVFLDGFNGSTVSVVQDTAGGKASIAPAGNA